MSSRIAYNSKEVELLARLIKAEALGEGQEGMLLVGNVVVNRVAAGGDRFKNHCFYNPGPNLVCEI